MPPSLLQVGFVEKDKSHLGSVTDMSLRESHMPVIVNKNTVVPEVAQFVIGTDGSGLAHACIELALRLARPTDRVTAIHVEDVSAQAGAAKHMDSDEVEAKYVEFAKTHPALTFRRVVKSATQSVADCILAQAREIGAHYICVGVDQMAKLAAGKPDHYIGSITDRIVRESHCTVIVMQAKNATYDVTKEMAKNAENTKAAAAATGAGAGAI